MSADKYPYIFLRQIAAIVYIFSRQMATNDFAKWKQISVEQVKKFSPCIALWKTLWALEKTRDMQKNMAAGECFLHFYLM